MNPHPGSALARADLLRALAVAGSPLPVAAGGEPAGPAASEHDRALAQGLGFCLRQTPPAPTLPPEWLPDAASTEIATPRPSDEAPVRPPLRIPFWGITACHALESAGAGSAGEELASAIPPQALTAADFAARSSVGPPFQPLQGAARIASRMRAALSQPQPGQRLDVPAIVRRLARLEILPATRARWPRRPSAGGPQRLWVMVDRSMAMRTLWDDQDFLLRCLGKWLGKTAIDTWTIPDDPWQPVCAWLGGRKLLHPELCQPPAGTMVLLLTAQHPSDPGAQAINHPAADENAEQVGNPAAFPGAHPGASGARAARWQQLAAFLGPTAAKVWWYAPYGKLCSQQAQPAPQTDASDLAKLLTMLACARRIEPALLRAVRLLDPALAAKPHLEAALWASPALEAGFDVAVLRADQINAWRQQFEALPAALQQQIWLTLERLHAVRGRAIEVQETLALAAHASAVAQAPAMQEKVALAGQWLQRLLQCEQAHAGHRGFAAFAAETFAFHAHDSALLHQHESAFLQLFAIADAAQGPRAIDPGALALDALAALPALQNQPAGKYRLCQRGGQLALLQTGAQQGDFAMGMPLELAWLLLDDGQRRIISTQGQPEVPLISIARLAQKAAAGQLVRVQTPRLAWELGQILPPFNAGHGWDEYGLYAMWPVAGQVLRLRYIAPGEFVMGSPEHEAERDDDDEGPQHRVIISQGFWLCDTACTQGLWQAIMGKKPSRFVAGKGGGPQHPVETVSWLDVQQFLQQLNQNLPLDCPWQASLPTEAEWEYACRAGTTTPFAFGENIHTDQVNFNGEYPYAGAAPGQYRERTVPVDAFERNAWGLYQMHGNVWEWCADLYEGDAYRQRAAAVTTDPALAQVWQPDLGNDGMRSVRGGGWGGDARRARSAYRGHGGPGRQGDGLGFRLALRSRPR